MVAPSYVSLTCDWGFRFLGAKDRVAIKEVNLSRSCDRILTLQTGLDRFSDPAGLRPPLLRENTMEIFDTNLNPLSLLIKSRNQAIDSVFYDVSSLSLDEWLSLSPWADKKGKIIVVSPGNSSKPIRHYESSDAFLQSEDWENVHAVAVAGVGSSVIGTAALARNVADAIERDVAGVVSGYGVSDVVLEGLGGWFFYGKLDQFRYELQNAVEDLSAIVSSNFARTTDARKFLRKYVDLPLDAYVPSNLDVSALHDILLERYKHEKMTNLTLVVGHSKGNLLISSVLNHMSYALKEVDKGKDKAFHNLAVVTLGAVVDIPKDMILEENQYQFLGTLDVLGRANSRAIGGDVAPRIRIPGVWHSLNSRLPGHMDVLGLLKSRVKLPPPVGVVQSNTDAIAMERRDRVQTALRFMASIN